MSAYLVEPAPALLDHEIGRGLTGSAPSAHGSFRQPCPLGERKRLPFAASRQGLDVAPSHNEPIASLLGRQSAGPNPSTNRLSSTSGQAGGGFDVQLIAQRCLHE